VPGSENYIDKKTYKWEIVTYNDNELMMKFTYDYPEYISVGQPDTMKITFSNTEAWIVPSDSNMKSTPQGFI